jgi:hypothetical protein
VRERRARPPRKAPGPLASRSSCRHSGSGPGPARSDPRRGRAALDPGRALRPQRRRAASLRPRRTGGSRATRVAGGPRAWTPCVRSGPGRRARPPMERAPAGRNSGSASRAMNRHEAGLGAWRDRTVAPRAHRPSQPAAVRMPRAGGARGRRFGRARGGCLTQRGELESRVDGPAHQGAQGGAPLGSAGGQ